MSVKTKVIDAVEDYCRKNKVRKISKRKAYEIAFDRIGSTFAPEQRAVTQFLKLRKQVFSVRKNEIEYKGHFDEDGTHGVM